MAPESTKAVARASNAARTPNGRFVAGAGSPNPGGKPKGWASLRDAARALGPEALETLGRLLRANDERVRLGAAIALLDRGYGRPAQAVTGEDGGPVRLEVSGDAARAELKVAIDLIRERMDARDAAEVGE